jgi:alkylhydroperoxidase family enzyme
MGAALYSRAMIDRHAEKRRRVEDTVLRGPGKSDPALRQAAADSAHGPAPELPPELAALVDKVHRHAYQVTDQDLADLKTRYSDDQLFEIVVSAAVGAARARFEAGLRALEQA